MTVVIRDEIGKLTDGGFDTMLKDILIRLLRHPCLESRRRRVVHDIEN